MSAAFFADEDFSSILSFFHDDSTLPTLAAMPETFSITSPDSSKIKRCASDMDRDMAAAAPAAKKRCAPPAAATAAAAQQQPRRLWVKERSRDWWDQLSSPDASDAEFKKAFRMSRPTFDALCDALGAAVAKEDTTLRAAIPVKQRVAVCIWRLATGEPLRLVSKRFGLGISTCHKLVLEVCAAIKNVLMPQLIRWPESPQEAAGIAERFEAMSGIPGVVGAMYTTHIPIIAPKTGVSHYYNRRHTERNQKTSYSVTIQGVVDCDGVLRDVSIGSPGSMTDEQVLEKSAIYIHEVPKQQAGYSWVVGGGGYPLLDWLLVPYSHKNLTWTQHLLNDRIGAARGVAKEAFARLKARWGCLQKRTEVKLGDLPAVLAACCVLHNVCERSGDAIDPELLLHQQSTPDDEHDDHQDGKAVRSATAAQKRDAIAHNLLHSGRKLQHIPSPPPANRVGGRLLL